MIQAGVKRVCLGPVCEQNEPGVGGGSIEVRSGRGGPGLLSETRSGGEAAVGIFEGSQTSNRSNHIPSSVVNQGAKPLEDSCPVT